MRIRFHFRWIPFVVMLLLVALGISLAQWQQRRAEEKLARAAKLETGNLAAPLLLTAALLPPAEAQAIEFRRVSVTGHFVPAWTVYLDNRPYHGKAGCRATISSARASPTTQRPRAPSPSAASPA